MLVGVLLEFTRDGTLVSADDSSDFDSAREVEAELLDTVSLVLTEVFK